MLSFLNVSGPPCYVAALNYGLHALDNLVPAMLSPLFLVFVATGSFSAALPGHSTHSLRLVYCLHQIYTESPLSAWYLAVLFPVRFSGLAWSGPIWRLQ